MVKALVWSTAAAVVATVGLLSPGPVQAQWGTIKGQVIVTEKVPALPPLVKKGDAAAKDSAVCAAEEVPDESVLIDAESGGVANVVIWLAKKPAKIHPDLAQSKEKEVVFDQKGCRFIPHVLLLRTDQKVRVLSDDAIAHNTHTNPFKNKSENFIVTPSDRKGVLLPAQSIEEKMPASINCDIHPWMKAWWVILDHPYAAVTDAKGEFEIANLPVGEQEFKVWQERTGWVEKSYKVTVKAGENKLPAIKVPATSFAKK